ncbi:PSD1 and planctomycete cytochrome C domain-containing protein [Stieleria maiorica]|uniref:PSD1 and planctomycete cytochrome C domain-containing protein n=1 Tax=Stieleria maiorica TaxID=2795974 RepID=UPI00142F3B20|nr:PSD1 and planctomycete cytochrome C domain-containing protein [Stieleria maiorica]
MTSALLALACCGSGIVPAAERDAESIDFFERKIRPVLVSRCYECHSSDADLIQGGLRVDDAQAMLRGGDSGAAVSPGRPAASLLLTALRYDGMEMPPDEPLPERVIRDFETWIRSGAAMPDLDGSSDPHREPTTESEIDWDQAKQFWAFSPPTLHQPDEIEGHDTDRSSWAATKTDRFVLARLSQNGLAPNPAASKATWLRRVTFDLTGLPPTIDDVDAFNADHTPDAKLRVVDRLLASPQHAERWARIWLDVARFAEDQAHIVGNNDSLTYPNAYLYRDWVIHALADDMRYDEFVSDQMAADLRHPDDPDRHVALGFIGLGPKYYRRGDPEVMADEWEDRIDTVSRGLLGLTVACARCHDHKFDPVPTTDYYAIAGVFASTEMFNRPLDDSVKTKAGQAEKPQDAMHIVREGNPRDLKVMIRGDAKRLGESVPRGFLTVLERPVDSTGRETVDNDDPPSDDFQNGSGRVALADAIADPSNPLTARVIVNRVWHQLMGTPIVATPSNFGSLGAPPSHPLLLDDLAVRFMNAGWSLKWLQREIVLSSAYGQSSDIDSAQSEVDPDNRWRWRMPRRRLSLEGYRDAILAASGRLDTTMGGRSIDPQDTATGRRTVYSHVSRLDLNPMLARFDFPDPNAHSPGRHETTTPLQKLFLLNSPFLIHHAEKLAERIRHGGQTDRERIEFAYRLLYGRPPGDQELGLAENFVADGSDERWNGLAQTLLISNEMFMLD